MAGRVQTRAEDALFLNTVDVNVPAFRLRRVSWGAILSGVVIALMVGIMLNMLGLSIAANSINPETEFRPAEGVGTGVVIWLAASTLISLFLGGLASGYLSRLPSVVDGALHGLVTWGVTSLLILILVTSGLGSVIGGIGNMLGQGISFVGQQAAEVAPEIASALQVQDDTRSAIQNELQSLFAPAATGTEGAPGEGAVLTPEAQAARLSLSRLLLFTSDTTAETERENLIGLLTSSTGMNDEQARQTVQRWEQQVDDIQVQVAEVTERVAQQAADATAVAAGVIFAALIIGAFAAGAGGYLGAPEPDVEAKVVDVEPVREEIDRPR